MWNYRSHYRRIRVFGGGASDLVTTFGGGRLPVSRHDESRSEGPSQVLEEVGKWRGS